MSGIYSAKIFSHLAPNTRKLGSLI